MYPLVESIKLENGIFRNLAYHDQRLRRSVQELFGRDPAFDLQSVLNALEVPGTGLFKCRFMYDDAAFGIEINPYTIRSIKTLKIIHRDKANYPHKYLDRTALDEALTEKNGCDDVIIVREGWVTDASAANVAFRKNNKWVVPSTYLLPGTMRQKLIDEGKAHEAPVRIEDIRKYQACKLINAMVEFDMPEISVANIVF